MEDKLLVFLTSKGMTENRSQEVIVKLKRHEDIFNEFVKSIQGDKFIYNEDSPVFVENYTAASLKKIVGGKLSDLGVYNYLIYLREKPEEAKENLAKGLPNKDSKFKN